VLSFVRPAGDPKDPNQEATSTWLDMFRIENGKIAEHWDPAPKQ
jgi:predicted SnoaL-like aldol condensation-catalyzing enzyme